MEVATFNGATKVATLTSGGDVSVRDLYSAALRWVANNPNFSLPFEAAGGEVIDPSAGLYTAIYLKCLNGWRISAAFSVNIVGGVLMVDGGGVSPFVVEPGVVQIQYKTPVEAIGFATGGTGTSGPSVSAEQVASAVWSHPWALTLAKFLGWR